jgi:hypothetical protein
MSEQALCQCNDTRQASRRQQQQRQKNEQEQEEKEMIV